MSSGSALRGEPSAQEEARVARSPARPRVFITWYPYCRRSDALAQQLGARSYLIHYLRFKAPYLAPIKYIPQALRTLWTLIRERPSLVLVANPPFVAPLLVWIGSGFLGYRFIIDCHSGAFHHSLWSWSLPVQRFLARRAVASVVTNEHLANIVRSWGGKVEIIQDLALDLDLRGSALRRDGFHVVHVCTYSVDEPVEEVVEAARRLPEVTFSFTGDPSYAPRGFRESLPPNVRLTGFIPDADYLTLLRGADAILVLTSEDHTMQRGGYEAVALEKPLITSEWPLLRQVFSRGTLHVDNTAEGIVGAIRRARSEAESLRREMSELKRERARVSTAQVDRLRSLCEALERGGAV